MRIVRVLAIYGMLLLPLLGQETTPAPQVPTPEEPPVFVSAKGPILLPNRCAEVDLAALGLTCGEGEPCETYLEWSDVEVLGNVMVLAGNAHTTSTTIQSLLLVSEDNGATWREAHKRIAGATLDSVQFFDFSTGWLSGQTALGGLPRDPFLLLTTDSGRSWRKVDLFAETRVGVIEDYAFQTARRGWLLVDNKGSGEAGKYEFYETQTGGTSWELKEISDRVPKGAQVGKRPPVESARVRVDDKRGLLRVEVRAGNGWREVSAFKLKLADCKPNPEP